MARRTSIEIEEEITAVRAAYLESLKAESLSYSSGPTSRSLSRTSSTDLKKQLDSLYVEKAAIGRQGRRIRGVTPV